MALTVDDESKVMFTASLRLFVVCLYACPSNGQNNNIILWLHGMYRIHLLYCTTVCGVSLVYTSSGCLSVQYTLFVWMVVRV